MPPIDESTIVLLGDLQRTSRLEAWRERNDAERLRLVRAVAERRPGLVVLLGDLVFDGSSRADWETFDEVIAPLRAAAIPIVAVPGNHEYWWAGEANLPSFFGRLPELGGRRFATYARGPLALVLLDSNAREMAPPAWREQLAWYEAELARLDADPAVRGVLVVAHHPPLTNSRTTGDERHVAEGIVPPFARANKTLLLASGHVHSYERFVRGQKTFLVAGGGGGPRVRLLEGVRRRHPDDRFDGPAVRDFHFVSLAPTEQAVLAQVLALSKGGAEIYTMDRFPLAWPA